MVARDDLAHREIPERTDPADAATTQACASTPEGHDPDPSGLQARPDRAQWEIPRPSWLPPPGGGRPPETDRREVVNAILYVLRTGCAWGLRPHDFPRAEDRP